MTVNIWNSLPNWIVSANTTNMLVKTNVDWFWQNQEILYDYKVQLDGTGSQSNV